MTDDALLKSLKLAYTPEPCLWPACCAPECVRARILRNEKSALDRTLEAIRYTFNPYTEINQDEPVRDDSGRNELGNG